ncbi:MAG: hypothetical protein HYR96_01840 [Deltaproteobacteria bacterium]|nr:hypothetical protein [Deltaproteobacteria bacterium]MBI3295808.1 hypothetical protein [Deltaproteobacteria bacterium]
MVRFLPLVFITGLISLSGAQAAGAPYYKFWAGYQRLVWDETAAKAFPEKGLAPGARFESTDFLNLLNRWLIPATTSCCAKESLIAYLPVLRPEKLPGSVSIPDEMAIIVYKDKEAYERVRADKNNPEAIVYGPLHALVFLMGEKTKPISTSYETTPFVGQLESGHAYDVLNQAVDWQEGYSVFRILLGAVTEKTVDYVKSLAQTPGLLGHLVRVDGSRILEYQNWKGAADYRAAFPEGAEEFYRVELKPNEMQTKNPATEPLIYRSISWGEGATIRFTPGTKPGTVERHPLLPPN